MIEHVYSDKYTDYIGRGSMRRASLPLQRFVRRG